MDDVKILTELRDIKSFESIAVSYDEKKKIFELYVKIKGSEDKSKDILNNIDGLDYKYNDFGLFEVWFSLDDNEKIIEELKNKF